MISTLYRKMILIIIFTFLLFFHIKDKEYNKMIALTLITGVVSYLFTKEDIYEGVDDTIQFTEEEEEVRRREWLEKLGEEDEGDESDAEEVPLPSNTPVVSAEYVKQRDKARAETGPSKEKGPEGVGPTEPIPISSEGDFAEKEEVKIVPTKNKFRIGPYDGLCISSEKLTNEDYVSNDNLKTYFGTQGPIEVVSSQDVLVGPTIDGEKDSPQKLSMFANNKTNFHCCGESPFTTSTGCICMTDKQRNYIHTRGLNKNTPDI